MRGHASAARRRVDLYRASTWTYHPHRASMWTCHSHRAGTWMCHPHRAGTWTVIPTELAHGLSSVQNWHVDMSYLPLGLCCFASWVYSSISVFFVLEFKTMVFPMLGKWSTTEPNLVCAFSMSSSGAQSFCWRRVTAVAMGPPIQFARTRSSLFSQTVLGFSDQNCLPHTSASVLVCLTFFSFELWSLNWA